MVFLQEWGSNRHAANVAFICLALTKYNPTIEFVSFSRKQIHLLLGDAGRSYVVGFGNNPPLRPHHSGASCPDRPAPCGWDYLHTTNPNPQILYGALVGGPNSQGIYEDRRNNYVTNEVALDYNAGFQSALAALLVQQKAGKC
ncbi:uncharacterized protein LOC130614105 [Hydractinia symbiolongicarpus]|uniref:uncharacterized protein LOC130614105 n=1 Tax=Hydractinia symbiolongicarpus TaxID=13093 RepID=UPI00254E78F5|nr:uncharacterized protein LOC130614105 [Hydractinia symbiolongicarpus]